MNWKKLPAWLKGAIIGFLAIIAIEILGIALLLSSLVFKFSLCYEFGCLLLLMLPLGIIYMIFAPSLGPSPLVLLPLLLLYPAIGAIIGLVYQKIKNNKQKK